MATKSCKSNEKVDMKDNNCLMERNFEEVWEVVMRNPSRTTLIREEIKWEIVFYMDNDIKTLQFIKDGHMAGIINSNLEVFAVAKVYKQNEKIKAEIKNVFCRLLERRN